MMDLPKPYGTNNTTYEREYKNGKKHTVESLYDDIFWVHRIKLCDKLKWILI